MSVCVHSLWSYYFLPPPLPPPVHPFLLSTNPKPTRPSPPPAPKHLPWPRPQRDDLLELERQLAKLGLESKTGGPGGRARHRQGVGNPGAHLSSALGESFCLLNQSVIFGGGLAGGGAGGAGGGGFVGSKKVNGGVGGVSSPPPPPPRVGHPSPDYIPPLPRVAPPTGSARGNGNENGNSNGNRNVNRNGNGNGNGKVPLDVVPPTTSSRSDCSKVVAGGRDGADSGGGRETEREDGGVERPEGSRAGENTPLQGRETNGGDARDGRRAGGRGQVGSALAARVWGGGVVGGGGEREQSGVEGGGGAGGGIRSGGEDDRRRLSGEEEVERRAQEEEKEQGEIMRLLTCLKTLGDENVSLMKECEDRDKASEPTVEHWLRAEGRGGGLKGGIERGGGEGEGGVIEDSTPEAVALWW